MLVAFRPECQHFQQYRFGVIQGERKTGTDASGPGGEEQCGPDSARNSHNSGSRRYFYILVNSVLHMPVEKEQILQDVVETDLFPIELHIVVACAGLNSEARLARLSSCIGSLVNQEHSGGVWPKIHLIYTVLGLKGITSLNFM